MSWPYHWKKDHDKSTDCTVQISSSSETDCHYYRCSRWSIYDLLWQPFHLHRKLEFEVVLPHSSFRPTSGDDAICCEGLSLLLFSLPVDRQWIYPVVRLLLEVLRPCQEPDSLEFLRHPAQVTDTVISYPYRLRVSSFGPHRKMWCFCFDGVVFLL